VSRIAKSSLPEQMEEEPEGNRLTQIHLENARKNGAGEQQPV